jgi:hypothetical protein
MAADSRVGFHPDDTTPTRQVNDDIHTLQNWLPVNGVYEIRYDCGLNRIRKRYLTARHRPNRITGAEQSGYEWSAYESRSTRD